MVQGHGDLLHNHGFNASESVYFLPIGAIDKETHLKTRSLFKIHNYISTNSRNSKRLVVP